MRPQFSSRIALVAAGLLALPGFGRGPKAGPGEKYALLVGVKKYDPNELRPLPYSEADVTDLAAVLRGHGYRPGNIVLMTQAAGVEDDRLAPRAPNIRRELKLLLRDLDPGDSILVAFAGHGVEIAGDAEAYFCPSDARLADRTTLIGVGEIYRELEASEAGLKVLLVDACRNDPQSDNSRSRASVRLESATRPRSRPTPGGVVAFFSCSAGEKAFEHSELKHGVFFHFVIEGLRGAAAPAGEREVLVPDLKKFVKRRVRDFVREKYDVRQMPEMQGRTRDLVPLVVLPAGDVKAAPPAAPRVLPPTVRILKPTAGFLSRASKVLVAAEATPQDGEPVTGVVLYVNGVQVTGKAIASGRAEGAADSGVWKESRSVELRAGTNRIEVVATNRVIDSKKVRVDVTYERKPIPIPPPPVAPKPEAAYLGLVPDPKLAFIHSVLALAGAHFDSPAGRAGVKGGDLLIRFNGAPVKAHADYRAALARCRPGQSVPLDLIRAGRSLTLTATLAAGAED